MTKMLDDGAAMVVAAPVGVPVRARQQALHLIRAAFTGLFGRRPAVLALYRPPPQLGGRPFPRLRPGKARRDPGKHLLQPRRPPSQLRHTDVISRRAEIPKEINKSRRPVDREQTAAVGVTMPAGSPPLENPVTPGMKYLTDAISGQAGAVRDA